MNTPDLDAGELNSLKQELAAVRQQVNVLTQQVKDLTRFFDVQPADPEHGIAEKVVIRCTHLTVFHRRGKEKESQIRLVASNRGPHISLHGTDDLPRITLKAEDQETQLDFFNKDSSVAVQIRTDETGCGSVGVLQSGKPRAAMKVGDNEGVVTVVHDDGRARVCMRGGAETGELNIVSSQAKSALSLFSAPAGGAIQINDCDGSRRAAIMAAPGGGQVALFNDLSIPRAYLGSFDDSAALQLNWGGNAGVTLAALEIGGILTLNDVDGNAVTKLPELPE